MPAKLRQIDSVCAQRFGVQHFLALAVPQIVVDMRLWIRHNKILLLMYLKGTIHPLPLWGKGAKNRLWHIVHGFWQDCTC